MHLKSPSRVALTLLLALAAAALGVWLRTPLPWMIGPLLVTAIATIFNAPTESWVPLRNAGQWTLGASLGLYFTPQVTTLVAGVWWAIVLSIAWSLVLGMVFSRWLYRAQRRRAGATADTDASLRATTFFAGAIGGASEMTLLAEREGARTDLVASAHTLRLLIVTLTIPFAFTYSGLHGADFTPPVARQVDPGGLAVLLVATGLGAWLLARLGRPNPWFLGPLAVSMAITMAGVSLSAFAPWMSNAAQLVIGVSLGVRFTAAFVHTAPRWLAVVALGTVGMIVLCAGFGLLLAWATAIHPATMILGTSPGGIAEMAITAKVLQLGVPVVTAFQVCRLIAVLLLVDPAYRLLYRRAA